LEDSEVRREGAPPKGGAGRARRGSDAVEESMRRVSDEEAPPDLGGRKVPRMTQRVSTRRDHELAREGLRHRGTGGQALERRKTRRGATFLSVRRWETDGLGERVKPRSR
jgi:hypothetical protein